jgi:uncharacterized protein YegL
MPISITPTPKKTVTHLALLIDSSGSMRGMTSPVVKNVNDILENLQKAATDLGQEVTVSLYSFGGSIDQLVKNIDITKSPRLKATDYRPDGMTPLCAAVRRAISDLTAIDGPEVANLLTLVTDGDSTDHDYTLDSDMVKLKANDRWTFSFVVPGYGGTRQINNRFPSVPAGNIREWDTTEKGLTEASVALNTGYANYLSARSLGATSSNGFFTANVTAAQAKAAKQNLDDVQGDFDQMTVRTQDPKTLQEFIESRKKDFVKGRAFYQLTKSEKVQPQKEILLRECKSGKVYGGAQARGILGLPPNVEVKVKPADHGDWDVFVQSTSNNRKLMPGTNLLYLKRP